MSNETRVNNQTRFEPIFGQHLALHMLKVCTTQYIISSIRMEEDLETLESWTQT